MLRNPTCPRPAALEKRMTRTAFAPDTCLLAPPPLPALSEGALVSKQVVALGDNNTQASGYVAITSYYLDQLYPDKSFSVIGLGAGKRNVVQAVRRRVRQRL
ncbi:MAG: hypothetical protein ABGY75_18680, partial [Gemmataceae bacterium]